MDAITMLKNDHKAAKALFRKFEQAGDRALTTKRELAEQIIRELSVHTAIEEQVFYPAVRDAVPDAESAVLEGLEEHHVVKWVLTELDGMSPEHERFDAKMHVVIEAVRKHADEEEKELFPLVRQALGRKLLQEIGETLEGARRMAPTHPHPRAPETPPANIVAGMAAGVVDRARDYGQDVISRARDR